MSKVYIIAELGSVAEGDLPTMIRQIDAAAAAGATSIKAQWLSSPARLTARRRAHAYAGAYQHLAYPAHWLEVMRGHATRLDMGFGCSCYLPEDAETIAAYARWIKIASFEQGSDDLRAAVVATGLPIVMSLGMASHEETLAALDWKQQAALTANLLHCVSSYDMPISRDQWNLGAISAYGLNGFSDHTRHPDAGHAAVLVGAKIVEAHLRLDDTPESNPDYGCAKSPAKFAAYVRRIREAEILRDWLLVALGSGRKAPQSCEEDMRQYRTVTT